MALDALRLTFVLEAERRGLLPLDSPDYAAVALSRHGTTRLPALQSWLMTGAPSFRGTLLDPSLGGPFAPLSLETLDATLQATRRWDLNAVGTMHEGMLAARSVRKQQGSFFTPEAIAARLTSTILDGQPAPRLLDPAMGCGAFLVAALRHLTPGAPPAVRARVALDCLHGRDQDPVAVGLAVLGLWLEIGEPALEPTALMRRLQVGDGLSAWPEGLDAVVGNPPFLNVERLEAARRAELRARFPGLRGRFDLYVCFVEHALDRLPEGGRLGLVLPKAFLSEEYAEPTRRRLLSQTSLLELRDNPAFCSVPTVSLSARKEAPAPDHVVSLQAAQHHEVPQALWTRAPGTLLRTDRSARDLEEALRLLAEGLPLGRVAIATWGVRGVPISRFHLDHPEGPDDRPLLKGDCLRDGVLGWRGKYLRYRPRELYRPLFPELFERPKIVVAKVTGARGLEAAIDRAGYYTDDSLICLQPKYQLADLDPAIARRHRLELDPADVELSRSFPLEALLSCLQAPETRRVFDTLLGSGLNVYPAALKRLPVQGPRDRS
ncbi:MAG TPA: N-6 DNA methylase [Stenomitos sp.]